MDIDYSIRRIKEIRQHFVEEIWSLLEKGMYNDAYNVFRNEVSNGTDIKEEWLSTEIVIFDIAFAICKKTEDIIDENIFTRVSTFEDLKKVIMLGKRFLRRFENEVSIEDEQTFIEYVEKYKVDENTICELIRRFINNTGKVSNAVAKSLFNNKKYDMVLPLLIKEYIGKEKNEYYEETCYNLAHYLALFGDFVTANDIVSRQSFNTKRYVSLKNHITHMVNKDNLDACKKRISFIVCVNDEDAYSECEWYINKLIVPEGYDMDIIPVRNARSMCSGYNIGMNKSDARYKIYIHQDVLCVNKYMLYDILEIFNADGNIGLIGVAGCDRMPETGMWWDASNQYYYIYQDTGIGTVCRITDGINAGIYETVDVIDGVLMATSKDVGWREDLFKGFHFYDISQSMEFKRKGYEVVIGKTSNPWILHDEKVDKFLDSDYEVAKTVFLKEYEENIG
ncbi:MAG: glycosyltransferase family protein [Lachnospiraceae bacterium]|nr:glycosyltransferase family protein [Lachnospiraceae bacterium]